MTVVDGTKWTSANTLKMKMMIVLSHHIGPVDGTLQWGQWLSRCHMQAMVENVMSCSQAEEVMTEKVVVLESESMHHLSNHYWHSHLWTYLQQR